MKSSFGLSGSYILNVIRDGRMIASTPFRNGIVIVGKNEILDTMFGSTAKATWYGGLIDSITTLSANDTMASHAGWTEFSNYDEATRPEWEAGAAADKAIENPLASMMEFTINDTSDPIIEGAFLCSNSTPGGTTGILWSTGALAAPVQVYNNDVVQLQYKLEII